MPFPKTPLAAPPPRFENRGLPFGTNHGHRSVQNRERHPGTGGRFQDGDQGLAMAWSLCHISRSPETSRDAGATGGMPALASETLPVRAVDTPLTTHPRETEGFR